MTLTGRVLASGPSFKCIGRVDAAELDRVVDEHRDAPVAVGARLVSVIGDCLQHLGQAAYVKGLPGK